jgi:hypothetical protein
MPIGLHISNPSCPLVFTFFLDESFDKTQEPKRKKPRAALALAVAQKSRL